MILCSGEALIDMLPRVTTAGEDAFAPYPGGAVFNTAIALGRLGAPAGLMSGISTDLFGQMLIAALADSNVATAHALRSDHPTTLAFVRLVDGHASYAFYDENTAGRMLDPQALPAVADDVTALFFGGISLAVEPCGSFYEALMTREAPARLTMMDPNIRPGFIRDEAAYRARMGRMIALADIVKVSDEDLAWLLGPGDTADKAAEMLALGPSLVFVTEGAKGAAAYSAAGVARVPAPSVRVVDTVGAGDTFNAGAMAALFRDGALSRERLRDLTLAEMKSALSLGARAAAVTVSRAGANPPWQAEL